MSPRTLVIRTLKAPASSSRRLAKAAFRRLPEPYRRAIATRVRRAQATALRRRPITEPRPGRAAARPEITVVVTSCDRAELLATALRSVQMQDFPAFECIVVDEDSTDDAVLVAQSFAAVDPRFRILHHDVRRGPSAARNTGLAAATTPYVCFLDDDDFLLAGSLRARRRALVDQPADVAGALCDWINPDPGVGLETFRPRRRPVDRGTISLAGLGAGAPFILSSPLLRTDVLRAVGGFDEGLGRAEDTELWFRLCRLGYRFVDSVHLGIAYRRSPRSLVTGAPAAQLDALLEVFGRAEAPDDTIVGHGPLPATGPLSGVVLAAARQEQVLRYLALIAVSDRPGAVERGIAALHPNVRRALDVERLVPRLRSATVARLGLAGPEIAAAEAAIREMLQHLAPALDERPAPLVDVDAWRRAHRDAVPVGPPPTVRVTSPLDGMVVLTPEARYHVDELGPLAAALEARGIATRFMASPKTVPAALAELARYTDVVAPWQPESIGRARAVVTLNDWGPLKPVVQAANEQGIPTFAKVEGVQDFDDVESSWQRDPYRTAAVILAQGQNDVGALAEKETIVVGSSRLERLWLRPPVAAGDVALVNLNFTFHVLTEVRDQWLAGVVDALGRAGTPGLVSTHPAERGIVVGLPVAAKPFRHEITKAGVLISRFSTVPFEAMARGVPVIYHNPHGERFPTFTQPLGAFPITTDVAGLAAAVHEVAAWRRDYRERSRAFFARQVDVDPGRSSAERAADAIIARL